MAGQGSGGERKVPKPGGRYVLFVGVAFATLIVVATLNTINNNSAGVLGLNADIAGRALPEFAVPDIRGNVDADANVFQDDCSSSQNPCPADDRRPSACEIKPAGAIRVCDYFDKPLAISFWFMRAANCLPAQDAFNRVAQDFSGRANFLSIDIRDDRDSVRQTATDHGWSVPVGWDRDGAVSDVYRVGGCPTVAFVYPGGIFAFAKAGDDVTEGNLRGDVNELIARSEARAEASR
jgi:AhpC/TSA family